MTNGLMWDAFRSSVAPDNKLNDWQWGEENIKLPKSGAGEPGQWDTDGVEYIKKPMEWMSPDSPVQTLVNMKGTQVIATTMGDIIALRRASTGAGSVLFALPSMDVARRHIKTKVEGMIDGSDYLKSRLVESVGRKSGSSTVVKQFLSGSSIFYLSLQNPRSGRNLSTPFIMLSDVDGVEENITTDKEGHFIRLFKNRADAFPGIKKFYIESTPTVAGQSVIEKELEKTAIHDYQMPCPHCGHMFAPGWGDIIFEHDDNYHLTTPAVLQCPACLQHIDESEKDKMKKLGDWIPRDPNHPMIGKAHGIIIPSLLSKWITWSDMAQEFLAAKKLVMRGDTKELKTFINTRLAQTWEENANRISTNEIAKRAEDYPVIVPRAACLLTAGIDMQQDCFKIEVVAWGRDDETWSIDYKTIWGNPAQPQVWAELDTFLQQRYDYADTGRKIPILYTCIDTGGTKADGAEFSNTAMAYKFIKGKENRKIFGIKGMSTSGFGKITGKPSIIPVDIINKDKRFGEVMLFPVYTDIAKDTVANRLLIHTTGPGYMHFPTRYDDEYYEGLLSERKGDDGKWKKKRANIRNEPLDCRVYNLAARDIFPFDFNEWADNWDKQFTS